ncbi:atypical dual specificity phosphatase [Mytilus galloprovincialis]|uniref:Atypical dual specificity phosphatase n=1 Tax=Mytilus galloprovincialis TaxID=29158 RepID=A0A8B6CWH1_MYTGA|nr:atypical dual specificity phosphatase [Mytilus galloprovincialis]
MANSLLDSLKSFDKTKLKQTDTKITTTEGLQIVEKRDSHGRIIHELVGGRTYGFVASIVDDLQVGEVLSDHLIIGSQDVAHDLSLLEKFKVTHILNLASYVQNKYPDKIKYKTIKINDLPEVQILPYFDQAFEFIDEGVRDGCVLVHCNAGVSRCSTVIIGYLMKTHHMSLTEAYNLVKEKRPAIRHNDGFRVQLKTYEEKLKMDRKS